MKDKGFTLIELMVVVVIVGILTAIAALGYSRWTTKYSVETQIKEMYSDLIEARTKAMGRNRTHFVTLLATQYTIRDDTDEDGVDEITDTLVTQKSNLTYQLSGMANFNFDSRGIASNSNTFCIRSTENPSVAGVDPSYDCIILGFTRINLGKLTDQGGNCDSDNCQAK